MSFPPRCRCPNWHPTFVVDDRPTPVAEDCPIHGKALRKRSTDDWTPFLGVTSPNQTESSQKVGVTPIH